MVGGAGADDSTRGERAVVSTSPSVPDSRRSPRCTKWAAGVPAGVHGLSTRDQSVSGCALEDTRVRGC